MQYTGKRSPFFMDIKMAADKDGKIQAMESDWSVDHGPYSEFGDLLTLRGAAVHGRRLQHSQHPRYGSYGLYQPCLGLGVPRLRLAAGLPGLRKPGG